MKNWKPIEGWPGYFISRKGEVMGRQGKLLKAFIVNGYLAFNVMVGKARKSLRVHQELLRAFKPGGSGDGRHLDDNPLNNSLKNLAWGTRSQNVQDGLRNGANYGKRLGAKQTARIAASTLHVDVLAKRHDVHRQTIYRIKRKAHETRRVH